MNKEEKLTEATMLALQGKLVEGRIKNVKSNGIEVLSGSADQYFFVEPTLLKKDDHYIWVNLNWEELSDLENNLLDKDVKEITLYADFYLDDDTGKPMQEEEQKEFISRDITMEDLEYFKNEIENIKSVLVEYAKWSWNDKVGDVEFPEDVKVNVVFGRLV